MHRSFLLTALLTITVVAPAVAQRKIVPVTSVRIGSWNIEHLGDPGARRSSGANVLQKAEDLARYIAYSKVDILALQEIKADGPAPTGFPRSLRTSRTLTKTMDLLSKKPGNKWKHVLFPKMRSGDTTQWTGVAWNSEKIKQVGRVLQVPVKHTRSTQRSNLWDRNLYGIKFSAGMGKTDFVVLTFHLKANTAKGSFARHRGEEITDLMSKLATIKKNFSKDEDLVFLGDGNILDSKEQAISLFQKNGFVNLNSSDKDTHTARGKQPFDRIFVPGKQKEFLKSKFNVLDNFQREQRLSYAKFRALYSDHYIIYAELTVMADDD